MHESVCRSVRESVGDGILWMRVKWLTKGEVMVAALMAQVDACVHELPGGDRTMVRQGRVNLAGGQKQRVAIERALDVVTEARIWEL